MEKCAIDIGGVFTKSAVIILDIEGTTTSISFVKDTLFPYVTENVGKFLTDKWEDEEVQKAVEGLRLMDTKDMEGAVTIPDKEASKEDQVKGVSEFVKWLVSIDSKDTHMKQLSGLIWQRGYQEKEILGHVYEDVKPALESWQSSGKRLLTYSSGSVLSQRLLLQHSSAGDLLPLLSAHYDTHTGHKQQPESYTAIVADVKCKPEETLFLTDIVKEASAAQTAGVQAVLVVRPGNAALSSEDQLRFPCISCFSELSAAAPLSKRKTSTDQQEVPPAKVAKLEVTEEKPQVTETEVAKAEEDVKEGEKADAEEAMEVDVQNGGEETKPDEPATAQIETESKEKEEIETEPKEGEAIETDKPKDEEIPKQKTDGEISSDKEQAKETEETCKVNGAEVEAVVAEDKQEKIEVDQPIVEQVKDDVVEDKAVPEATEEVPVEEIKEAAVENDSAIGMDTEIEDKLNDLLGEEGAVLEKECDEILSKVEQVTNMDIASKIFIQKAIAEQSDVIDEIMQVAEAVEGEEAAAAENAEDIQVDDIVATVTEEEVESILPATKEVAIPDSIDATPAAEPVPEKPVEEAEAVDSTEVKVDENLPLQSKDEPAAETPDAETPAEAVAVVEETEKVTEEAVVEKHTNGDSEKVNDSIGDSDIKERMNGERVEAGTNGSAKEQNGNGKADDSERLQENGKATEPASESDPSSETTEIKVKKITPEEIVTDKPQEQVVET